ncbi:MAG: DUF2834 domain-containing protein [Gemmatimonadetes bacterium]|nr:DUF2834 domain-containing protein [Gemmatimonadota bacterium]
MKALYLGLALVGAVVPYIFFIAHIGAEGLGLDAMLSAMFANSMASTLTSDLFLSSFVFWIWLVHSKTKRPWVFVALNLCIGLSCALPAYLYARERERASAPAP